MFIKFHHHHFSFRKFLCISLLLGFLTTTAIHLSKAEINKESPNPLASLTTSSPTSATTNSNDTWKISYFHHDHLGNITAVTDEHGNLLELKDYLPFGGTNVDEHYGDSSSNYSYNDKEKDDELNLYYYGARYYNAATGKFTSIDPAVLAIGTSEHENLSRKNLNTFLSNPQLLNSYSYAANNPINNIDPNGNSIAGHLFWKNVVSVLRASGYKIAAFFLNHSIKSIIPFKGAFEIEKKPLIFTDDPNSKVESFMKDQGYLASRIKESDEYKKVLSQITEKIKKGNLEGKDSDKYDSSSKDKDLFYTFGKFDYEYSSSENEDGTYAVYITIQDRYDFDSWSSYDSLVPSIGNNLGYLSEGIELAPFDISVHLKDNIEAEKDNSKKKTK